MANYSPIRDAFRDLNRLIYDRERFAQEKATREMAHRERMLGLQSQMEQAAFNRDMQVKRFDLLKEGADREATQAEFYRQLANKRFEFEKNKWKTGAVSREEALKQQRLQNKQAQLQINNYIEENKRRPVSINTFTLGNNELLNNEEYINDVLNYTDPTGQLGLKIGPRGTIIKADGSPFVANKKELKETLPGYLAINNKYDNTPVQVQEDILNLQKTYNDFEQQYKQLANSPNPMIRQQSSQIKVQLNRMKAEILKKAQFFSPSNQIKYFNQKEQRARQAAALAYKYGNISFAKEQIDLANKYMEQQNEFLTKMYGSDKPSGKDIIVKNLFVDPNIDSIEWQGNVFQGGQNMGAILIDKSNPEAPYWFNGKRMRNLPIGVVVADNLESTKEQNVEKLPAGTLTEKQMINMDHLAVKDALGSVMFSDAVKPMARTLETMISKYHKKIGGKGKDRIKARETVLNYDKQAREAYFRNIDAVMAMTPKQLTEAIQNLIKAKKVTLPKTGIPKKIVAKRKFLKGVFLRYFKRDMRRLIGDKDNKVFIYKPNRQLHNIQIREGF